MAKLTKWNPVVGDKATGYLKNDTKIHVSIVSKNEKAIEVEFQDGSKKIFPRGEFRSVFEPFNE